MTDAVQILLVEDNPDDVELTLHAFKTHRLTNPVHVAQDGVEALDLLFGTEGKAGLSEGPVIVLLDLKLPKVDGLEVLKKLRADPRSEAIPVVVLTSSRSDRDIIQGYHLGVDSYIVKPVDFAQFTEAVRTLGLNWLLTDVGPGLHSPASGGRS
jgi:CheY-like chemotaxis protein